MLRRTALILYYIFVVTGLILMCRISIPYTKMQPNVDFLNTKISSYLLFHWRASFYLHVFTSVFVFLSGIIQFTAPVLKMYKKVHRVSGYVYTAGVLLVSGPSGLIMGFYANGGLAARTSFVVMAVFWLLFTAIALVFAFKKKWEMHGVWMVRSYALTLSALTLRLYALLIGLFNVDIEPANAYILIAWLSWTVNLLIAELWMQTGGIHRFYQSSRGLNSR